MKLFESCVRLDLPVATASPEIPPLTTEEANALRYVAGYVPFALKKKQNKRPEFQAYLDSLAVSGRRDSSFLDTLKNGQKLLIVEDCLK